MGVSQEGYYSGGMALDGSAHCFESGKTEAVYVGAGESAPLMSWRRKRGHTKGKHREGLGGE